MRIIGVIQARMGSTRLPGKVMADIGGKPMLWHVVKRLATVAALDDVIVATPDEELYKYANHLGELEKSNGRIRGFWYCDGADDVLARYAHIATQMAADGICRVTGDCPLLDPKPISDALYLFQTVLYDYVANDLVPTWPDGLGVEVFSKAALDWANTKADKPRDREHVTPFIKRDGANSRRNIRCPINGLCDLKLSVDTQDDLDFVRAIDAAIPRDYSLQATLEAIDRVKTQNVAQGA